MPAASLPSQLQFLVVQELEKLHQRSNHRVDAQTRRSIYQAFGPPTERLSIRARSWLAILTAQKVLPIFQQALPAEDMPQRLIEMAIAVVEKKVDVEEAYQLATEGHEMVGRQWGYDEADVPWNAWFAGNAAVRALLETVTHEPFQRLDKFWKLGQLPTSDRQIVRADEWLDEELAQVGGDVASAAAMAWACGTADPKCDPDKLREFWEWWLAQAIPKAWEI